jgi:flavin reductase (DIM6/NTAB) family NADH-FMN oxidoreductase RutF
VTTCDGKKNNVMTITWTMVVDFTPRFAMTTGAWNYSFRALDKTRECVLAIPGADLLDSAVGIGTCSGADTDKFAKFHLTPVPARIVQAPLIKECWRTSKQGRRHRPAARQSSCWKSWPRM